MPRMPVVKWGDPIMHWLPRLPPLVLIQFLGIEPENTYFENLLLSLQYILTHHYPNCTSTFDNLIALGNNQILDVRTSDEFDSGYIKGAVNIDFWDPAFKDLVKAKFDKSLPILVYCAGGGRSAMAANNLRKKGFKTIYNLEGGYESYTE